MNSVLQLSAKKRYHNLCTFVLRKSLHSILAAFKMIGMLKETNTLQIFQMLFCSLTVLVTWFSLWRLLDRSMNGLELVRQVSKLKVSRVGLWTCLHVLGPIRYCLFYCLFSWVKFVLQLVSLSILEACIPPFKGLPRVKTIWTPSSNIWEIHLLIMWQGNENMTSSKWALVLSSFFLLGGEEVCAEVARNVFGWENTLVLFSCISICVLIAWTLRQKHLTEE